MSASCLLVASLLLTLLAVIQGSPSEYFSFSGGQNVRQPSDNGDDGSYYKVLGGGVNKLSNVDDIKRAYRKKAMMLHPDKGGDAEDFKTLSEAYEVLSDVQKRAIYDKFGISGLSDAGRGSRPSASDMAREFFRGFGAFSVPLVFQLDLSLEDFYMGKEITIPIDSSQQVKVVVEPGMFGGQELIARAEYRGMLRDIVLRLLEIRHPIFLRKNADLLIDVKISLVEALLGFKRIIRLLDGKEIEVQSPVGEISGPETVYVIKNMGMPVYRTEEARGNLFVRLKMEMPKKLDLVDSVEIDELRRLLTKVEGGDETYRDRASQGDSFVDKTGIKVDEEMKKSDPKNNLYSLLTTDIRNFGQSGGFADDDEDDFQRNPFAQYFFR